QARMPRQPISGRELLSALRLGMWALLLPVAIVVGSFGGYVAVSEAAACAGAYVLLLEGAIHRTLELRRQLPGLLAETAMLVGSILIILGVAMGLTNLLIDAQVPTRVFQWLQGSIHSQLAFLALLNVFLLALGCMMDIFSATVVVVPLILPLAHRFGVDPIHLGILFLANLEIGYSTPPVGINLFIASQRFGRPVLSLFRAAVPFLVIMLVWLAIVTYVPETSLWWRH
ncbi:MAG: TRAP transporter large permease subunit, partial [Gammaproteobacteria bacterium]